ncbi:hypothetical protein FRC10_000815, partial [Ceratobasidium sp. 414]
MLPQRDSTTNRLKRPSLLRKLCSSLVAPVLRTVVEDRRIGLAGVLELTGDGTSFIITEKGLDDAARRGPASQNASDNLAYLKNPM